MRNNTHCSVSYDIHNIWQIPPTENLVRGDAIFAYDIKNKNLKWIYHGNDIANIAICFGDGKIYLAENKISAAQKRNALQEKNRLVKNQ